MENSGEKNADFLFNCASGIDINSTGFTVCWKIASLDLPE